MKPENNATRKHKKIVIWGAVILAVTLLGIVVWKSGAEEQKTWDTLYESGYTFPAEVGAKLAGMDAGAGIRCARMGLTQDECPQSTGDTVRRLMATMMTQQAERHGPGPYGKGYAPEYAVAINHIFYQFIQFLEEFPCQPMLYRYASEKTLHVLQEGEFIHRCGKGWRINSEWKEQMEQTDSIKPVGDAAMERTSGGENTFRIGVMESVTGPGETYGNVAVQAKQMAVEEINAAGGINGLPLELIVEDSKCNAQDSITAYKRELYT